MKELGRKNLCYSLLLAAVMMMFLIGYFIWMLPSLYVSYAEEQNLEAIKKQHQVFMETGAYDEVYVKNPTACMSVKIPFEENYIEVASKIITLKISVLDQEKETVELMKEIRSFVKKFQLKKTEQADGGGQESEQIFTDQQIRSEWNRLLKKIETIFTKVKLPVQTNIVYKQAEDGLFDRESFRIHAVSGHGIIVEATVFDQNNQYTNYLAVEQVSDGMVFSALPVITPQMEEIRPIVMQSVPMLGAVLLILVLIFSQLYSSGIVHPVYQKLQDINQSLLEENERQEMFLRASSHQLKTPVTAALLLLDGMIGQIGKYKDREKYLPKVKEQLLSMRRMIEEILSLHKSRGKLSKSHINLYAMVQAQAASYQVAAAEKLLDISMEGNKEACIWTDGDLAGKMIDNLLSNAVAYTPQGGRIAIFVSEQSIMIQNEGVVISQDMLPHIFEPFVCGEHKSGTHGLGLYIASYYAKMIDAALDIQNRENCVEAVLNFHQER